MRIHSTDHKFNIDRSSCESSGYLAPKSGKSTQGNKVWTAPKPGQPKIKTAVGINPQPAEPVQQGPVEGSGRKNTVSNRKVPVRQAVRTFNQLQALVRVPKQEKPAQKGSSQHGTDSVGSAKSKKGPKAPAQPVVPPLWTILNVDEDARAAFMQPISAEAGAALKKAVAKTTGLGPMAKVFGFEPKWFRDDAARLTHRIKLLNDRLSIKYNESLHNENSNEADDNPRVKFEKAMHEEVFNKADDICKAIRLIAGDIEKELSGHPSVALLRKDAEKLEKYLATAYFN